MNCDLDSKSLGLSHLNSMEGYWDMLKLNSLMHEHYDSVDERVGRAPCFLQNSRISIDCETYIFRDPKSVASFVIVHVMQARFLRLTRAYDRNMTQWICLQKDNANLL